MFELINYIAYLFGKANNKSNMIVSLILKFGISLIFVFNGHDPSSMEVYGVAFRKNTYLIKLISLYLN